MHTFKHGDWTIIHHGDYSGDATIIAPDKNEMAIPCETIRAFVAEQVRGSKIAEAEDASVAELLGLKT